MDDSSCPILLRTSKAEPTKTHIASNILSEWIKEQKLDGTRVDECVSLAPSAAIKPGEAERKEQQPSTINGGRRVKEKNRVDRNSSFRAQQCSTENLKVPRSCILHKGNTWIHKDSSLCQRLNWDFHVGKIFGIYFQESV